MSTLFPIGLGLVGANRIETHALSELPVVLCLALHLLRFQPFDCVPMLYLSKSEFSDIALKSIDGLEHGADRESSTGGDCNQSRDLPGRVLPPDAAAKRH